MTTCATPSAGKPPRRACSRTRSSLAGDAVHAAHLVGGHVAVPPLHIAAKLTQHAARNLGDRLQSSSDEPRIPAISRSMTNFGTAPPSVVADRHQPRTPAFDRACDGGARIPGRRHTQPHTDESEHALLTTTQEQGMSPNPNQQTHLIESELSAGGITRTATTAVASLASDVPSRALVPNSSHSRVYTFPSSASSPAFPVLRSVRGRPGDAPQRPPRLDSTGATVRGPRDRTERVVFASGPKLRSCRPTARTPCPPYGHIS
jgi:hypothetical protein